MPDRTSPKSAPTQTEVSTQSSISSPEFRIYAAYLLYVNVDNGVPTHTFQKFPALTTTKELGKCIAKTTVAKNKNGYWIASASGDQEILERLPLVVDEICRLNACVPTDQSLTKARIELMGTFLDILINNRKTFSLISGNQLPQSLVHVEKARRDTLKLEPSRPSGGRGVFVIRGEALEQVRPC